MNNGRGAINQQVINQASGLFQKAQREADANNVVRIATQDLGVAGRYPIQLGSADPEDVRIALRQQNIGANGVVAGNMGIALAGDREFEYLQRKKEEVFYSQFLSYINAQADLSNPATAAWWFERFPFLKEKRLEEINREAEKQKRMAQIQVTGPQNEDDFFLMYLVKQGLVSLPTEPLTKLWETTRYDTNRTNYTKGMFSPLSVNPQAGIADAVGLPTATGTVPYFNNPFEFDYGNQDGIRRTLAGNNVLPTPAANYNALRPITRAAGP